VAVSQRLHPSSVYPARHGKLAAALADAAVVIVDVDEVAERATDHHEKGQIVQVQMQHDSHRNEPYYGNIYNTRTVLFFIITTSTTFNCGSPINRVTR
jgi:hypothetical protein